MGKLPAHLPARLAITLWDFSWYTRAGSGEPYADLDTAFAEAVERGYNAVRICAAPLYLFGPVDLPADLGISGLGATPAGGIYGEGTRWYDVPGGYAVPLLDRLVELFEAAARHGCVVILSTWEYQQSPSFAATDAWWRAIDAIPVQRRLDALARASAALVRFLEERGHGERIAFVELHNEVDFSRVPADSAAIDDAIAVFRTAAPGHLVTVSYGMPPHLDMAAVPESLQVGQFHVYAYGVLDALQREIDLRETGSEGFPNPALRRLLRADAPRWEDYGRPEAWRLEATVITDQMLYGYDNIDATRWDLWLYDNYGAHREEMRREIRSRVTAVAAWCRRRDVPLVIGEGWVGYTPLRAGFEEGPVGKDLAEVGLRAAVEAGAWGAVLCSNAAPHHPFWADVEWQRQANRELRG
ncbi:cellulase-like family protein [Leifsonia sp. ZF2019]|uniref:cellulase-like family protein n=1 Tax=Leifsonia sp. ZF2019 TaxID=2781978 RepID=UPI001CC114B7|nr:cellulase-like family protein [Leifsonia sp. ZF2019]